MAEEISGLLPETFNEIQTSHNEMMNLAKQHADDINTDFTPAAAPSVSISVSGDGDGVDGWVDLTTELAAVPDPVTPVGPLALYSPKSPDAVDLPNDPADWDNRISFSFSTKLPELSYTRGEGGVVRQQNATMPTVGTPTFYDPIDLTADLDLGELPKFDLTVPFGIVANTPDCPVALPPDPTTTLVTAPGPLALTDPDAANLVTQVPGAFSGSTANPLAVPNLAAQVIPDAPAMTAPTRPVRIFDEDDLPTFAGFTVPVRPDLDIPALPLPPAWSIPEVDFAVPTWNLPNLSADFAFADNPYSPEVLGTVIGEVRAVVNGRMAVPAFIWDGVWSRAAGELSRQAVAQKREARRAHAKLGWSLPGGTMLAKMDLAEQAINEQITMKALEQSIQQSLQTREDFWQAMQQGVACEALLLQADTAYNERRLKAAIAKHEADIAVYNAMVQVFNAEVQGAQVNATIFKTIIDGELAKLEAYKAEIQGVSAMADVGKTLAQMYTAEWGGVQASVEAFKAQVDASVSIAQIDKINADIYIAEWEAARIQLEGYKAGLEKYRLAAENDKTAVQLYATGFEAPKLAITAHQASTEAARVGTEADRNAVAYYQAQWEGVRSRVAAYDSWLKGLEVHIGSQKLQIDAYQAKLAGQDTQVKAWMAEWDAYGKQVQGEQVKTGRYEVAAKVFDSRVAAYKADADAKVSRVGVISQSTVGLTGAAVQRYSADIQLEQVKLAAHDTYYKGLGIEVESDKATIQNAEAKTNDGLAALKGDLAPYEALTQINAINTAKAQAMGAYAQAFSAQAGMYNAKVQAEVERLRSDIELEKLNMAGSEMEMKIAIADSQANQANAQAQASVYASTAQARGSEASAQASAIAAQASYENAKFDMRKLELMAAIEGAKIQQQAWQTSETLGVQVMQARSTVYAQLTSAAYSAINMTMGYSGSRSSSYSQSDSTSTSYNYSGEISGE